MLSPRLPPSRPAHPLRASRKTLAAPFLLALAFVAIVLAACPMPAPDGCTPGAWRCGPNGAPEVCSPSARWSPSSAPCAELAGHVRCCLTRNVYDQDGAPIAACVQPPACLAPPGAPVGPDAGGAP